VLVVEARGRVGGRVWSETLVARDGQEAVIERGAEFILDGYDRLRELAARHALTIADTGMSYYVREPRGAEGLDAAALARAGGTVAKSAGAGTGGSVADVISAAGLPPSLADAVRARVEISCALEANRLGPSVLAHVASFEPLPSHRVAGGNQRLAEAMANALGPDRLRLNTPVLGLSGNRLVLEDGELEADRVVLALPLPVLHELAIDPPLPDWKREALNAVEIGQAAKLHLRLLRQAPTSAVLSVPDRFWCWAATAGDGRVAPVLNCFAGSPNALNRLGVEAGAERWVDRVATLRSDLLLDTAHPILTVWQTDPYAGGAYRADGLTEVDEHALAAPVEQLHFAGEWAAGPLSGLMEGALRSGVRAADEVAMNRPPQAG